MSTQERELTEARALEQQARMGWEESKRRESELRAEVARLTALLPAVRDEAKTLVMILGGGPGSRQARSILAALAASPGEPDTQERRPNTCIVCATANVGPCPHVVPAEEPQ